MTDTTSHPATYPRTPQAGPRSDEPSPSDVEAAEAERRAAAARRDLEAFVAGFDLADSMRKSAEKALKAVVDKAAAAAIAAVLTDDVLAEIQHRAAKDAETALAAMLSEETTDVDAGDQRSPVETAAAIAGAVGSPDPALTAAPGPEAAPPADDAPPPLAFASLPEFVQGFIYPHYRRRVGAGAAYWLAQWWRSAEAIARLEAMWRSFEALRHDPALGISVWFRDHGDYHMGVLMSDTGPFSASTDKSAPSPDDGLPPYLPAAEMPADLFEDQQVLYNLEPTTPPAARRLAAPTPDAGVGSRVLEPTPETVAATWPHTDGPNFAVEP